MSENQEPASDDCPCGSGRAYTSCCGPLLAGARQAATAEALMRARYTAHARGDREFLVRSWHPDTCPATVTDGSVRWTGLEVLATEGGRALDRTGTVTFAAHCVIDRRRSTLRECSRFVRIGTRWVYLDGTSETAPTV